MPLLTPHPPLQCWCSKHINIHMEAEQLHLNIEEGVRVKLQLSRTSMFSQQLRFPLRFSSAGNQDCSQCLLSGNYSSTSISIPAYGRFLASSLLQKLGGRPRSTAQRFADKKNLICDSLVSYHTIIYSYNLFS